MPIPSSSSERCSESFGEHKVPRMVISMALNATFFHYPNHCFRCYLYAFMCLLYQRGWKNNATFVAHQWVTKVTHHDAIDQLDFYCWSFTYEWSWYHHVNPTGIHGSHVRPFHMSRAVARVHAPFIETSWCHHHHHVAFTCTVMICHLANPTGIHGSHARLVSMVGERVIKMMEWQCVCLTQDVSSMKTHRREA
jgi:hypothetical protein